MTDPVSPAVLDVSRWQFAITIAFHMTFPAITVGLAVFLAVVYGLYLRTRDQLYLQIFRFWKKIFAVGFALGVVAGTVITFEFGLNWGPFAHATGPVLGPIIGMEVVTAFFVEAGFIGIMLYGDGRVSDRLMFVSTTVVAVGTLLSTTWILAANSWMQTPAGARYVNGQFVPTDWVAAILNPAFVWRYPHMLLAVLISASWLVAGVGAYYLVKGRAVAFGRRTFSLALGVLFVLLPVQLMVGDHVAARARRGGARNPSSRRSRAIGDRPTPVTTWSRSPTSPASGTRCCSPCPSSAAGSPRTSAAGRPPQV